MVWNMQKSAIEEINELKARLESITERAKAEALDKASEAIGFLRELGLENDTILRVSRAMENCPLSATRNCPLLG
jgi:vacuolar-type H+-ATPase subunit E/Vma4